MSESPPSPPPIVGPGDAWAPLTARFDCDRCGAVACTLTLLPPFARDPQRPPSGPDGAFPDAVRLSVDGPVRSTFTFLPTMGVDVAGLEAAMRAGDPDAIHALDPEYAPFWCRKCARSYCRTCWTVWVGHDGPFYDCTRGRCPAGHERILDD